MRFVRLGDVARIVCGKSVNWLNADCRDGAILLPVGSILVSINTTSGDFTITDVPIALGDDLMAIIIESSDIDANYIRLFLRSKTNGLGSNGMVEVVDGRNAVKSMADIDVPLPPLDEQRHMVVLLEKIESIRNKYMELINLSDNFLSSIFLGEDDHSVMNSEKWHTSSIAVQERYSQIRNKMMLIKEKLACELAQSNILFNSHIASAFIPVEAIRGNGNA